MRCRERGMALLTVLFMLAMLLIMALVVGEKALRATHGEALAGARDQALQAAGAGIEWARHRLAADYPHSAGWAAYLAAAPGGERYPLAPAFSTTVGTLPVDIYLRDNPDGDADPRHDNDLKVEILARARPPRGAEVLIESVCGFDAAASIAYRQGGGDARRSGVADAEGLAEPWSASVSRFHLQD